MLEALVKVGYLNNVSHNQYVFVELPVGNKMKNRTPKAIEDINWWIHESWKNPVPVGVFLVVLIGGFLGLQTAVLSFFQQSKSGEGLSVAEDSTHSSDLKDSYLTDQNSTDFATFLLEIPKGSTVTIIVSDRSDKDVDTLEAVFKSDVENDSRLLLVEPDRIKTLMDELPMSVPNAITVGESSSLSRIVEYIVLVRGNSITLVDVKTQAILRSKVIP